MSVPLQILVRLARRHRICLLPVVIFQGRAFALFRRVSVRTSCTLHHFRIQRWVWLSFLIVRCCRRMLGTRIRIRSCYRPL